MTIDKRNDVVERAMNQVILVVECAVESADSLPHPSLEGNILCSPSDRVVLVVDAVDATAAEVALSSGAKIPSGTLHLRPCPERCCGC